MKCNVRGVILGLASAIFMLFSTGCSSGGSGSGSNNSSPTPQAQNGTMNLLVSDASTEDWATIGVKILSVSLTPQGGGSDVVVYTARGPAPTVNLLQLDQLNEILGNVSVAPGTYAAAAITIGGNPGDVLLTVSADPEVGFAAAAGSLIPTNQIQIMGTQGRAGNLTVPVKLTLDSPLVVTANQSSALNLEFDLSHPAFIVGHVAPTSGGVTMWAVNFNACLRHRRIFDITGMLLRHHYGTATGVSSDNSSLMFNKDYPAYPPNNPETAISTTQNLTVKADATNGTLYYDVDGKTTATLRDFSSLASTIGGKFIRVAARYQVDGSLVAVRLWASSSFNGVWISPEGHVLHVNTATNTVVVENELGVGVPLSVDANTLFYFRTPANAQTDSNSIGQGTAFLSNLVRGFKVHASVVDPLASPFVAQSIDIEIARYDGTIGAASTSNFTYTRNFRTAKDDYIVTLPYISSTTPNGNDPQSGSAINGFKWWNFAFPTVVDSGTNAVGDFATATGGAVGFVCAAGTTQMRAAGGTYAKWNDPNAPNTWAAPWTVLTPTKVPLGRVAAGYSNGSPNGTFTMTMACSDGMQSNAITVTLGTKAGSAPLVYQVDFTNGVLTVSPVDVSTPAGQSALSTNLVANTPVLANGIPQADGTIKDYVLFYYTGATPTAASALN
jgi:hypothetical protein